MAEELHQLKRIPHRDQDTPTPCSLLKNESMLSLSVKQLYTVVSLRARCSKPLRENLPISHLLPTTQMYVIWNMAGRQSHRRFLWRIRRRLLWNCARKSSSTQQTSTCSCYSRIRPSARLLFLDNSYTLSSLRFFKDR